MSFPARNTTTTTPTVVKMARRGTPLAAAASHSRPRRDSGRESSGIGPAWQLGRRRTCQHEWMRGHSQSAKSRRRIRREVKWTITAVVVVLAVEFVVLPRLGGFRQSLNRVSHINIAYVIAGLLLEAAALAAYAQLTYTVLSPGAPGRWRLLRIDLSSLALSHVVPGGTAPGVGLSYRLLSQAGVRTADAGFGLAMQGVGSAVVLNVLFWLALIVSLFTNGFHALYTYAAAAGTLLMGSFAVVIVALTKGRRRSVEVVRQWADHVPFLNGDRLAEGVQRVADRLRDLANQRELLRQAILWAAANW